MPRNTLVEVVVLLSRCGNNKKEGDTGRKKQGYSGFTVETLYDTFMQTTPDRLFGWTPNQTPQQTAENHSERQKVGMIVTYMGRKFL